MLSQVPPKWRARVSNALPYVRYGVMARRGVVEHAVDRRGRKTAEETNWGGVEVVMGTVSAEHAQGSSMEHLLAAIRPHALAVGGAESAQQPALLALLLTPSYARQVLDSDFALRLLPHVQQRPFTPALDVLAAVVDRLPTGSEGLAYLFHRRPVPFSLTSQRPLRPDAVRPGSVSFCVEGVDNNRPKGRNTWTVQVPLAQTTFSNGLTSTLIHSTYSSAPDGSWIKLQERRLEEHTLALPLPPTRISITSRASLVPLTPLRVIVESMGNIVRRISAAAPASPGQMDSLRENALPASTELEQAISSYFKVQNMPPQPVQVWALILPPDRAHTAKLDRGRILLHGRSCHERPDEFAIRSMSIETIHQIWSTLDPSSNEIFDAGLTNAISHGARLCRVLSGGGGWGKKAGLLSLDPDTAYISRELRSDRGWEFGLEVGNDGGAMDRNKKALGDVVKAGDGIMFFLAPRDAKFPPARTGKISQLLRTAERSAIFGAIPSTVDAVPQDDFSGSQEKFQVKHQPGVFGALSEGGLAIKVTRGDTVLSQTKYDIPFGYIAFTGTGPSQLREQDVKIHAYHTEDRHSSNATLQKSIRQVECKSDPREVLKSDNSREGTTQVNKYLKATESSTEDSSQGRKLNSAVKGSNSRSPETGELNGSSTSTLPIRKHVARGLDWRDPQAGLRLRKFRVDSPELENVSKSRTFVRRVIPSTPSAEEKGGSSR